MLRVCVCVRVERRQGWSSVLSLEVVGPSRGGPLQPWALLGVGLRGPWGPSVSVQVVGTDPGRRERPCGKPAEHFLQLSSSLVLAEEIVGGDGNGDHPLRARWVRVPGRLTEGEKESEP